MVTFSPTQINALTDKLVAAWEAAIGTSGSGYGFGDGTFGFSKKAIDLQGIVSGSTVGAFADVAIQNVLDPLAIVFPGSALGSTAFGNAMTGFVHGMDVLGSQAGTLLSQATVVDLDSLMYYYNFLNGVTYWQTLAHPDWHYLFPACKNGKEPNPLNVYFAVEQGVTYNGTTFTNALAKFIVGTGFTAGFTVDTTKFAGGLAYMTWSGATGSGVVTVTGKDQAGATETWTGTLSGASSTGLLLTPTTHTFSLISQVTAVAAAGGISAGTIYIEARPPAGRTYPPT